jgi:hypothetical protein
MVKLERLTPEQLADPDLQRPTAELNLFDLEVLVHHPASHQGEALQVAAQLLQGRAMQLQIEALDRFALVADPELETRCDQLEQRSTTGGDWVRGRHRSNDMKKNKRNV